jgi:hypothetical protein
MPLQKIVFRPGVNRENTNYANEQGWYECDKVRFRSGFPEKIGGWVRLSNNQYLGVARSLWNWSTLNSQNLLGVGTNLKYYIEKGGAYYDITPIIDTETYTNKLGTAFSTLNGGITATQTTLTVTSGTNFPPQGVIKIDSEQISYAAKSGNVLQGLIRGVNGTTAATHNTGANVGCATITFTDVSNIADNNDFIIISGATSFGGISAGAINKEHQVFEVASGVCYFTTTDFSTSEVLTGGGTITVQFLEHAGLNVYTVGTGWGAGPWSRGTWGSGYSSGIGQQLRLWTNDNFGEDLIIAPRGGAMYYWDATTGVAARSIPLSIAADNAGFDGDFVPNATSQIIASSVQRFVICFGANNYDQLLLMMVMKKDLKYYMIDKSLYLNQKIILKELIV